MVKVIAGAKPKEITPDAPFKMTITLNGASVTFDTYPSSWIEDMELAEDFTMSENEFVERLEKEWTISTIDGMFNMLYEGNLLKDLIKEASVEVKQL